LGSRKSSPEPNLLDGQADIEQLCETCREEKRFAFDTEFVMEDRYASEVCLIQIATERGVSLIDPFRELDLAPIWQLVVDPQVETIVHAGQEDFGLAVQHTGEVPRHVFDVQIAAGLVGLDYPISLQRLVQALLHLRLHKSKTLTDWRRRPLSPSQIVYAAEDVVHLHAIRKSLRKRLSELERLDWAREEIKRLEDMGIYQRADEDKIGRVKGAGALSGQQLVTVRELMAWRERFAQRVNRPVRIVLKDHLMVEIAKHGMKEFAEIRSLRGINMSDRDVHGLCRTVAKAHAIPEVEWPKSTARVHETPEESTLAALATAVIRGYCLENHLAFGLATTQRAIKELIRCHAGQGNRKDIDILKGWRGRTIGALIDEILSGARSVYVAQGSGIPVLRTKRRRTS